MSQILVSGGVLKWAREFRMLTAEEAAEQLGITVAVLQGIEEGSGLVNLGLFEKFSQKYRMPQATLFRRTPPPIPKLPNDFRTLEGRRPRFSFEFSSSFSNVLHLHGVASKIFEEDDDWHPSNLPYVRGAGDPAELGEAERRRLNVSVDDQLSWKPSESFRRWRAHIESQGILVFLQEFPLDDCRGFTLYDDDKIPVIVINKSEHFDAAKTFTLIHEYAHILTRQPGISDLNRKNPTEAFCNKFAAGLLMPKEAIRKLLKTWPNAPVEWETQQVKFWASRLKVSQYALSIRLEELGLAPEGFSRRFTWHSGYKEKTPAVKGAGGPDPNIVKFSELGGEYISRVLDAYDRNVISESNTLEALGISTDALDKARKYINRFEEFSSGG